MLQNLLAQSFQAALGVRGEGPGPDWAPGWQFSSLCIPRTQKPHSDPLVPIKFSPMSSPLWLPWQGPYLMLGTQNHVLKARGEKGAL